MTSPPHNQVYTNTPHLYIETGVYTQICVPLYCTHCGTHLKIVTSLAVDLEKRLPLTSFPSFLFPVVPHVPMCAYSWIDNETKLKRTLRCFYRLPLVAMSKIKVMTSTRVRERKRMRVSAFFTTVR